MASNSKVFIAVKQTKSIRIGDVFEQVPGGFYMMNKVPKRSVKTGSLIWSYERKQPEILWPFEQVAQYVIEVQKPEKGRPGFPH